MTKDPIKRIAAELIGTMFLVMGIVGAGIAGESLSGGSPATTHLVVSLSTGAMLVVLISALGPISGAHFNPAVTLGFLLNGAISTKDAIAYAVVQISGGIIGVILTSLMFAQTVLQISDTSRSGAGIWLGELLATFGLALVIYCGVTLNPRAVGSIVGLYILAAHWFISSGAFSNPAVTIARMLTETFTGISPPSVPIFVVLQLAGATAAAFMVRILVSESSDN